MDIFSAMKAAARFRITPFHLFVVAGVAFLFFSACHRSGPEKQNAAVAVATKSPAQNLSHPIIGRWSYPLDGRDGFVREFRSNGTAIVLWPDRTVAAQGTFFIVDTNAIAVDYPNKDTDVVHLLDANTIQIDHVEYGRYHRKFYAERQ